MASNFVPPQGYDEETVIKIITNITNMLAPRFVFGYFDAEDIKQQGFLEAVKSLPSYRPEIDSDGKVTQPLEKFLYRHIYNRYINLIRDKYRRYDVPCIWCHNGEHHKHIDGEICKKYANWKKRNKSKSNLVNSDKSVDNYDCFPCKSTDSPENVLILKESLELIDNKLPVELRSAYLKMTARVYVPKAKRIKVMNAVREILRCP